MPSSSSVQSGWYVLSCHHLCALAYYLVIGLFAFSLNINVAHASENTLSLSDALSRTMAQNPRLQVFDLRLEGIRGQRITTNQNPALVVGAGVDNFLGTGDVRGAIGAELTLTLSSTLELGNQRQARVNAIDSQIGLIEAERKADSLALLGQVTQRFVATLAVQEKLQIADDAVRLAKSTLDIVTRRADQGATPQAEVLRARAALGQSRIERSRLQSELISRKMALTSLWGDTSMALPQLQGNLFQSVASDSFETLYQRVSESPALEVYASEQRVREAEVQLAQSQSASDVRWQVGVRRMEDINDTALTAGFSMPLFTAQRNRGELRSALAARDEVRFRREATLLRLHARLFEAYQLREHSVAAVEQMRSEVLPNLSEALTETQQAYESGRYSYVEWIAAQRELLDAQQEMVDAATTALLNQTLIEQLTAQPLAEAE